MSATDEFQSKIVGEIGGMRVMMTGRERSDGKEDLVLPSGLAIVTDNALEYLVGACREYDLQHLGLVIAEFSSMRVGTREKLNETLAAAGADPAGLLRDYQMALVFRVAAGDPDRTDPTGKRISAIELARLCRLAISSRTLGEETDDVSALLLRVAYLQFWDLESYDIFPRGMIMLREVADALPEADRYDLNEAFKSRFGFRFDTFVVLCFSLFALATNQPARRFGIEQLAGSAEFDLPREEIAAFLEYVSCDLGSFRERANDPRVLVPNFEPHSLNPLVRWPALCHSDGGVYVPIPRLLLDRATTGVYYDLLPELSKKEAGRFGAFWGNAFDRYIERILSTTPGVGPIRRGEELIKDGKNCDVIELPEKAPALFECKTAGLSRRSKTTGERSSIVADIEGSSFPEGVVQLAESRAYLKSAFGAEPNSPLMLVSLDEMYWANEPGIGIREMIAAAASDLTKADVSSLTIGSASDVESLCRAAEFGGVDPRTMLLAKMSRPDTDALDVRTFVASTVKPPRTPITLHREFLDSGWRVMLSPYLKRAT
jgi:hypothetical protein